MYHIEIKNGKHKSAQKHLNSIAIIKLVKNLDRRCEGKEAAGCGRATVRRSSLLCDRLRFRGYGKKLPIDTDFWCWFFRLGPRGRLRLTIGKKASPSDLIRDVRRRLAIAAWGNSDDGNRRPGCGVLPI
ncbi:unnamed protein product [Cuscuta campestris]|uniref:Uncharacterized protein n=1 Tax=Cuscuta campestris TaxID=132261 RepID=A0A484NKH0_9ASTE|nr:unnamed protein product [Cuscuta campestris]